MKSALTWFEIPVRNLERAAVCYETLLGAKLRRETFGGLPYGVFPYEAPGVSGALVEDPRRMIGGGLLVYLDAGGKLDDVLARADEARATVVVPKTSIGPEGYIAVVVDTEGNQVGFNSPA